MGWAEAGSRRHAGDEASTSDGVAGHGRRRMEDDGSDGVASGHGCRRTEDGGSDGVASGRRTEDDGSDMASGHGRLRMDKSTKWQTGVATDSCQLETTTDACEGRKQDSWNRRQVVAYRTNKEKQASYMPTLLCAPSFLGAHSSLLGLDPATAHKHDPTRCPAATGTCRGSIRPLTAELLRGSMQQGPSPCIRGRWRWCRWIIVFRFPAVEVVVSTACPVEKRVTQHSVTGCHGARYNHSAALAMRCSIMAQHP